MKTLTRVALCGFVVVLTLGVANAQPRSFSEDRARQIVAEAEALQKGGDSRAAGDLYVRGYQRAIAAGNQEWAAQFAFRAARLTHNEGALQAARGWYERTLEARPGAGAALNNLAEVYRALGDNAKAGRYYRKAIATDDRHRNLYIENFANWLAERGEMDQAAPLYEQLVLAQPQSKKFHSILMDDHLENPEELTDYLWTLEESGQIRRAQEAALDALEKAEASDQQRVEWLTAFVAALGRERFDPKGFAETDRGRRLQRLVEDPVVGEGASQVLGLLNGESWDRQSYPWWTEGDRREDPPRGMWPRDAFRRLARGMADSYKHAGQLHTAEACLEMAITLAPEELDPTSIGELADMYIENGDRGALDDLLERHEIKMFEAKGEAYRRSQKERILEYHRVLGKIYAHAGDTGTRGTAMTARFQLEHARDVAEMLEAEYPDETAPPRFDAELAGLLARVYTKDGQESAAVSVRLRTADRYQRIGDARTARRLVEPLSGENLPSQIERYPELRPYIKKVDPEKKEEPPPPPNVISVE